MSTPVLSTTALTKRYGKHTALAEATLDIPAGRIVGLVGPNGAGKSTLLALASGLIRPTSGRIEVLGRTPAADSAQLADVGFVAQDTPVYAGLSVADHLSLGEHLNPTWDDAFARDRIARLGLDPAKKAGRLSGGQKAQLALTIAAAKRPRLLIFDEPVAALDPLARRAFLQNLMEFVAELEVSVILSSHLIGDVERVCDHLIVLAESRVQVAGDIEDLLAAHHRLVGPRGTLDALPDGVKVIAADHTDRQTTLIVHDTTGDHLELPGADSVGLEDMVLTYLHRAEGLTAPTLQETRA
ncbi:ABC transporter ATP-binding protein [Glycomyces algeriensis]|uniref:ABC transporter ATP-binding protein n=1 Tax=Glycomyces algeriensis TaxID=256037 RepID=A0A9W6G9A4_9ACTN|nr:ABC transporter ATP-binding protein [Glycomyces algeriensis]MDA1367388.1 ABC transporter ATP-binding protein [Glycomyces algeriensis]MDR7350958.1 ABC-2 type transport system ATP-binding protein [Glycomyces algeriensis]GLI43670.1 ABC transporter ATP-binding protein [Glycomyces algeriensis]